MCVLKWKDVRDTSGQVIKEVEDEKKQYCKKKDDDDDDEGNKKQVCTYKKP